MFPLKKAAEGMSEEQKKKPKVERIADGLHAWGVILPLASLPLGLVAYAYIQGERRGAGLEELIRFPLTVWVFGFLAWFFCHVARYILKDITSDMQKQKPNMPGRLGLVLYWWGVGLAGVSLLLGIVWAIDMANLDEAVIKIWASGAAAYFVGRGARYVLKGD